MSPSLLHPSVHAPNVFSAPAEQGPASTLARPQKDVGEQSSRTAQQSRSSQSMKASPSLLHPSAHAAEVFSAPAAHGGAQTGGRPQNVEAAQSVRTAQQSRSSQSTKASPSFEQPSEHAAADVSGPTAPSQAGGGPASRGAPPSRRPQDVVESHITDEQQLKSLQSVKPSQSSSRPLLHAHSPVSVQPASQPAPASRPHAVEAPQATSPQQSRSLQSVKPSSSSSQPFVHRATSSSDPVRLQETAASMPASASIPASEGDGLSVAHPATIQVASRARVVGPYRIPRCYSGAPPRTIEGR